MVSLAEMEEGERGRIAYLLTRKLPRMHRLMSLGIVPGTEVEVLQKTPSIVIKVEDVKIALDNEVAGDIYVKKYYE